MAVQIPFSRKLDFSYGTAEQVAPGIRRVIAENPSPFTLYGTGTYILGTGRVAVIDPGPADAAQTGKNAVYYVMAGCPRFGLIIDQAAAVDSPHDDPFFF